MSRPRPTSGLPLLLLLSCFAVGACSAERPPADLDSAPPEPAEPADAAAAAPAVDGDAEPADAWRRNRIAWKTASEIDNFGYDVYRGDAEDGPFDRITEQPIPGHGTTDEPSSYEFFDTSIDAGAVYWYYVESISFDGARERFTPVFASKPKFPPGAAAAGEPAAGDPAAGDPAAGAEPTP